MFFENLMEFIFVHNAWLCVPAAERDLEIGLCLCLCMCQVVYVKYVRVCVFTST